MQPHRHERRSPFGKGVARSSLLQKPVEGLTYFEISSGKPEISLGWAFQNSRDTAAFALAVSRPLELPCGVDVARSVEVACVVAGPACTAVLDGTAGFLCVALAVSRPLELPYGVEVACVVAEPGVAKPPCTALLISVELLYAIGLVRVAKPPCAGLFVSVELLCATLLACVGVVVLSSCSKWLVDSLASGFECFAGA